MIPTRPLSRRTAMTAGLVAVGGAGCSVQMPGSGAPTPTPTPVPGALEPDVQIVVDLVDELRRSVALLKDTRTQHPKLAARLTPLLTAQKAHLAVLRRAATGDGLTDAPTGTIAVPARAPAALDKVLERTRTVRAACVTSAGAAESGAFARLLASMAAALSQRLVVIEAAAPVKAVGG